MLKFIDKISNKAFSNKIQTEKSLLSTDIYDVKINKLDGNPLDLSSLRNKHVLFVNVASKCGFTGQYRDLEKLYQKYSDRLMVVGVPSNQFGSQEPGSAEEIKDFCEMNYGVSFLMTEKIQVKGRSQHPLYQWLTQKRLNGKSNSTVRWNFQKYLVGPNGEWIDFYYSTTNPLSDKITKHLG